MAFVNASQFTIRHKYKGVKNGKKKKAGAHQVINRNERIYMKGFLSYLHLGMKNFPNKIKMFNKKI